MPSNIMVIIIYLPTAPFQHLLSHLGSCSTRPQSLAACPATGQQNHGSLSQNRKTSRYERKQAVLINLASESNTTHTCDNYAHVRPIPGWTPQLQQTLYQNLTSGTMKSMVSPD